ncbi:MAG: ThiF family adenylyltransferase [Chloroflexi bacterium]|nr:ThiF family adenylyltransferase [Chloroflexota bacterium]
MEQKLERYLRQVTNPRIGEEGQAKLLASTVTIIGTGPRGSKVAEQLARAGVGRLRLIDRDYIETHNLESQSLLEEKDIEDGLPKAVAAAYKLAAINSQIKIEPLVADANPQTIKQLLAEAEVVVDGTDNFPTRYLINDTCVESRVPWIYGGTVGWEGITATVIPYKTACLRCLSPLLPTQSAFPSPDTVGVWGPVAGAVASIQVNEALKLLLGLEDVNPGVIYLDLEHNNFQVIQAKRRPQTCPACGRARSGELEEEDGPLAITPLGADSVQVRPVAVGRFSLPRLAQKLQFQGAVRFNEYMLWFQAEGKQITVFPDGRAIIKGVGDESQAVAIYHQYIAD